MHLTPAQKATLKADIQNTPAANQMYIDGNLQGLADFYNAIASPAFIVWKSLVSLQNVANGFNAAELAGLTSINTQRLQNLAAWYITGVNPSLASVRQFFDDIFSGSGGANTRTALLALWKRSATRAEKLFSTGTGSDASPATMTVEGALGYQEFQGL